MISGPQTYAKLSSAAKEFLKRKYPIVIPKVVARYEYIGEGSNLAKVAEEESQIHKFLGQTAITDNVKKEFGQTLDTIG